MVPAYENFSREALKRGDLLQAYDQACQGPEGDLTACYLQVLALARMGEASEALQVYERSDLYSAGGTDQRALKGRLLKDLGIDGDSATRSKALGEALEIYGTIFSESGDYYPGINAATIARLLGRVELSEQIASAVLQTPEVNAPTDYFGAVTKFEAHLLMGAIDSAEAALGFALDATGADPGSRSTTLKQLKRLSSSLGLSDEIIGKFVEMLRPGSVAFYCGHIFYPDEGLETSLRHKLRHHIALAKVAVGYGALAAGADILIAESLLEQGAELHIVLPFSEADFLEASVAIAGSEWIERYARCKAASTSFVEATSMGYVSDPEQFSHGSTIAMGLARLRGRHLQTDALQIAVWNGAPPGQAGTGADVAKWQRAGGRTEIIPVDAMRRPSTGQQADTTHTRKSCAIIFADLPGFTKIPEKLLPSFWEHVMGTASLVISRFPGEVLNSNTWGDALYLVFRSATSAAIAMLQLQEELAGMDYRSLGFLAPPTFRIAGHFAPVYFDRDPITDRVSVYGVEVSKAARIEPVTPPGSIYVTASFAAQLEMEAPGVFDPLYVGQVPLAKAYGQMPIYRLKKNNVVQENRSESEGIVDQRA